MKKPNKKTSRKSPSCHLAHEELDGSTTYSGEGGGSVNVIKDNNNHECPVVTRTNSIG